MKVTKTTTKININGKEYNSVDEVPDEFKKMFEDKDGNGRPDFIDEHIGNGGTVKDEKIITTKSSHILKSKSLLDRLKDAWKAFSSD